MATLASVIQRGTRASQPAATAVSIGTLYSVTDESNKVERSNGTTWDQYAPSAGGTVTNTGTLTSGKTLVGNGGVDATVSSLTATVVKSSSGTLSAATAGTDYVTPSALTAATVTTDQTSNSASYGDLSTVGPSVTLTHVGTIAVIWLSAIAYKTANSATVYMSVDVSGSNTIAASDANAASVSFTTGILSANATLSRVLVLTGLTPGTTTFKLQYKADTNNNAHFLNRSIAVFAP